MSDFPFVAIPDEVLAVIGQPDPGTRVYRREGFEYEVGEWFSALNALWSPIVSPGGVSMFVPVSRAAVHKRLKEGRLTAFCFHVRETKKGFFGKTKTVRGTPYVYIPVSECHAWAEELKERMLRLGQISREELEGESPDWSGDFWQKLANKQEKGK
jgi:hypothetical protein